MAGFTAADVQAIQGINNSIQAASMQTSNWKKYKKAMAKQQEYNERNMQLQNEYNVSNWERQNAYNNPTAAASRWRAAGINPLAVYSGSPAGSGVAGEIGSPSSSTPSGTPHAESFPYVDPVGAANLSIQNKLADSQIALNEAHAKEAEANAQATSLDSALNPLRKRAMELANGNAELENKLKQIDVYVSDATKDVDVALKGQALSKLTAEVDQVVQYIENLKMDEKHKKQLISYVKAQQAFVEAQTDTERHRPANIDADTGLKLSQTVTEMYNREMLSGQVRKIDAETEEAKKRAKKVDAEIERIGKQNNLTEEQIKSIKQQRALAWSEFSVNVLKDISQEARAWLTLGLSKPAQRGNSGIYVPDRTSSDGVNYRIY